MGPLILYVRVRHCVLDALDLFSFSSEFVAPRTAERVASATALLKTSANTVLCYCICKYVKELKRWWKPHIHLTSAWELKMSGRLVGTEDQCSYMYNDLADLYFRIYSITWALSFCCHKTEDSNASNLTGFKLVFIPILNYSHISWIMIERLLFHGQTTDLGFWERSRMTRHHKVCSYEIRKALNVEPLILQTERF